MSIKPGDWICVPWRVQRTPTWFLVVDAPAGKPWCVVYDATKPNVCRAFVVEHDVITQIHHTESPPNLEAGR